MTTHDTRDTMHPDAFDQAARRHHAQALAALSAPARARLRAARHAASTGAPARRGFGWALAGSCAAVFAIAIAVQLQRAPTPATALVQTAATAPAPGDGIEDLDSLVAALDENPDLYLWLAANDDALPPPSEY